MVVTNRNKARIVSRRRLPYAIIATLFAWTIVSSPELAAKPRLLRLEGRIVLPPHTYSPKKRLVIFLQGVSTPYSGRKWAEPDGRFRFTDLVPGTYSLAVYIPEDRQLLQTVDITPSFADGKGKVRRTFEYDEQSLEAHLTVQPQSIVSARQLSVSFSANNEYAKAQSRLQHRDVDGAVKHLEKAVSLAPQFAEAINLLGTIAFQRRDFVTAERYFRQALEEDPRSYEPLVNLGGALLAQGRSREALSINLHAQNARPRDPLANAQLGLSYYATGDLDRAISYLQATEEIDAGHFSNPQLTLAEIYVRRADLAAAERELQSFLKLHPDSPHAEGVRAAIERIKSADVQTSTPAVPRGRVPL